MTDQQLHTALITGASSGLGREFAELFARDGADLVLLARREESLLDIARSLRQQHAITAHVIAADLADRATPQAVVARLTELGVHIDVLVNNAGFGAFGSFAGSDVQGTLDMIQVNVAALTHLTRLLLPAMIARGAGRIMNVASTAAFQPGPLMAVYYATKAFVLSFSEAVAYELRDTGVTVTAFCPGPTATEFYERAQMGVPRAARFEVTMDAPRAARLGYAAMRKGKRVAIPGAANRLLAQSVRFVPRRLVTGVVYGLQRRLRR